MITRILLILSCFLALSNTVFAQPSLEEMIGSMLIVGFRGTEAPQSILTAIERQHLGGVILFSRDVKEGGMRNIASPRQLKKLIASLQERSSQPLFIAVDQEGGAVQRLTKARGFTGLPFSATQMGAMETAVVEEYGRRTGQELISLGCTVDFAPVVDIGREGEASPGLGDLGRIFSNNPFQVTEKGLAFARGLFSVGIIPTLKHFPGLGGATKDSHHELPDTTNSWNENDLLPYKCAFSTGWPGMVMVGHLMNKKFDTKFPSSLSPFVIKELLRKKLGFQGVVVSDDLEMAAVHGTLEDRILLAIQAGNDILLFGNNLNFEENLHEKVFACIMRLVLSGTITEARLLESWKRIQELRSRIHAQKL